MDIGIMSGHHDYVKFLVLGRSRTGSNYLRGLLNSHSQIVVFGEIFKNYQGIEWGMDGYPQSGLALKLFQNDPAGFLDRVVFGRYPKNTAAVGFKLFYYHAQQGELNRIWSHIKLRTDIRILHVKRKNILRTHLSRQKAELTDKWANLDGEREDERHISLDYESVCRILFRQGNGKNKPTGFSPTIQY